jgi:hypothetical protein
MTAGHFACRLLLLLAPCLGSALADTRDPSLEVASHGHALYYRNGKTRTLLKRLKAADAFQGMSILQDGDVFLAYSTSEAGAGTILSIFDMKARHERVLTIIGGTGDSSFSVNTETGNVVFNWHGGLYVFSLPAIEAIPWGRDAMSMFEKSVLKVADCTACGEPKWSGRRIIEYQEFAKDGSTATRHVEVTGQAPGAPESDRR